MPKPPRPIQIGLLGKQCPYHPKRKEILDVKEERRGSQERGFDKGCMKSYKVRKDPRNRNDEQVRYEKQSLEETSVLF
jgi:hypothetical protein